MMPRTFKEACQLIGAFAILAAVVVGIILLPIKHHHTLAPAKPTLPPPKVVLPPKSVTAGSTPLSAVPYKTTGEVLISYNSALELGDDVLLYRATKNKAYLYKAQQLALAGYKQFGVFAYPNPPGNVIAFGPIYLRQLYQLTLYDGNERTLYAQQSHGYNVYLKSHPYKGGNAIEHSNDLWSEGGHYAYVWSQSMIAAADEEHNKFDTTTALKYYWNGKSWSSGLNSNGKPYGDVYWDDNVWTALDVIRAYEATHQKQYLNYAITDFKFLQNGWTHPYGGVRWVDANWNHDITAASTAGAEQVGLDLYILTGRKWDLTWSQGVQAWLNKNLTAPNGLIYDHKSPCKAGLCWNVPTPNGGSSPGFYDPLLYIAAVIS